MKERPNILITRLGSAYYGAEIYLVKHFALLKKDLDHITLITNQKELRQHFTKVVPEVTTIPFQWGREVTGVKSLAFFLVTYPFYFCLFGLILIIQKLKYDIDIVFLNSINEKLLLPFWAKLLGMKVVVIEHGALMKFWEENGLYVLFETGYPLYR